jgi:hypothetical protein
MAMYSPLYGIDGREMREFWLAGFALISCLGAIYRGLDAFSRAMLVRICTICSVDSRGLESVVIHKY